MVTGPDTGTSLQELHMMTIPARFDRMPRPMTKRVSGWCSKDDANGGKYICMATPVTALNAMHP